MVTLPKDRTKGEISNGDLPVEIKPMGILPLIEQHSLEKLAREP
jgi:hypothetical protein